MGACPDKPTDPRRSGRSNRLFMEAVLWIARTGGTWRDLPICGAPMSPSSIWTPATPMLFMHSRSAVIPRLRDVAAQPVLSDARALSGGVRKPSASGSRGDGSGAVIASAAVVTSNNGVSVRAR